MTITTGLCSRQPGKSTLIAKIVEAGKISQGAMSLTQDIFIGQPEWIRSATIERDGDAWGHEVAKENLFLRGPDGHRWFGPENLLACLRCKKLGSGFDPSNYEESAINRNFNQ